MIILLSLIWFYTDLTFQIKSIYIYNIRHPVDTDSWLCLPISPDPMMELMKLKEADILELLPPSVCFVWGESSTLSSYNIQKRFTNINPTTHFATINFFSLVCAPYLINKFTPVARFLLHFNTWKSLRRISRQGALCFTRLRPPLLTKMTNLMTVSHDASAANGSLFWILCSLYYWNRNH